METAESREAAADFGDRAAASGGVPDDDTDTAPYASAFAETQTERAGARGAPLSAAQRLRALAELAEAPARPWYLALAEDRVRVAAVVFVATAALLFYMRPLFVLDACEGGSGRGRPRVRRDPRETRDAAPCTARVSLPKVVAWSASAAAIAWVMPAFLSGVTASADHRRGEASRAQAEWGRRPSQLRT